MAWFEFSQNNSGGSFVVNSELCHRVFIEADNDVAALAKGMDMGIYLNGCDSGIDCNCCGDRWYMPEEVKFPMDYGDRIFKDVKEYAKYLANAYGFTKPDARLYYADGKVVEINKGVRS